MEKKFLTRKKDGLKLEILETSMAGLKVKFPNGNKAVVNADGNVLYYINPTPEEIAEEERAKMIADISAAFEEKLAAFKNELLEDLKNA